ncbi:5484_t:CDS:2 [Entrophospora sp. SA101]|nr:7121_t:CDS:2 [Entrophospora sp. SA101]CAJ0627724.1 5478_t:CDS:2 [Entrophospora sp. SA101]CAJ0627733.1 5484_t:CDS:2 [Entrophospora sp. SA101]
MLRNKILVIGRRGVGKFSIIPWNIETKYYKARVYFWIDETVGRNDINWEVVTGYLDEDNGIGDVVDAIIFVFRKDEPSTFEDIHTFLPFIKRYEPSITLANGFEYVDLEETKSQDAIERVGIDRILEALQSHMWEEDEDDDNYHKELYEAMSNLNFEQKNTNKEGLMLLKSDDEEEGEGESTQIEGSDDDEFYGESMVNQEEVELMYDQIFGDFDEEDGLDKVLSKLNNLRGKMLPDNERRKLAASVAYSFSKHMGD